MRAGLSRRAKQICAIFMGLVSIVALSFGLLFLEYQRSADSVFRAHEEELRKKIEAYQVLHLRRPFYRGGSASGDAREYYRAAVDQFTQSLEANEPKPLANASLALRIPGALTFEQGKELLTQYQSVLRHFEQALEMDKLEVRHRYAGHSQWLPEGSREQWAKLQRNCLAIADALHLGHEDADAMRIALTLIGVGSDERRGTVFSYCQHQGCVSEAIMKIRNILSGHTLSAPQLEDASLLVERIWKAPYPLAEDIAIEDAVVRMTVLDSEREKLDYFVWEQSPSWRHFFSSRLARLASLSELKQGSEELTRVGTYPVAEWIDRATAIHKSGRYRTVSVVLEGMALTYRTLAREKTELALLRTALAVARYETGHGYRPRILEDLRPDYLSEAPIDPATGRPFEYETGAIWVAGNQRETWTHWTVQRHR